MDKRWYIAQVATGREERIKDVMLKRVEEESLQEFFGQIVVPAGDFLDAQSFMEVKKEKMFPGYLLVEMERCSAAEHLVLSTKGVVRFLGGRDPVPLSDREVEQIFAQAQGKVSLSGSLATFFIGSEVQVMSGPFSGFVGVVESVDNDHERLTVMISIFGRMTPVDLSFGQVKN